MLNLDRLKKYSKWELAEIHNTLNNFQWDDRLGDKPLNWDELSNYSSNKYQQTKYTILRPYMRHIQFLIGEKECLKYHHLVNLKRNRLQFEWWWFKRKFLRRGTI